MEEITVEVLRTKNGLASPRNLLGIYLQPTQSCYRFNLALFDRNQIFRSFKKDGRDFRDVKLAIYPIHSINHYFVLILVRPDLIVEVMSVTVFNVNSYTSTYYHVYYLHTTF